ncbi:MAG: sigma factor-like helix-turn-helix DNA-binding protein [Candidatus Woesearchaeota archaeon]
MNNTEKDIDLFYNYLIGAMECLTDRERKILALRYGLVDDKFYTLQEIGNIFNFTRERSKQLITKIIRKIKKTASVEYNKGSYINNCYELVTFIYNFVKPESSNDILRICLFSLEIDDLPNRVTTKLVTEICYQNNEIKRRKKKESVKLLQVLQKELLNIKKENKKNEGVFKDIFSQVIWPTKIKKIDEKFYKQLSPKRQVNENGEGESGVFYSKKIGRSIHYESLLELDFINNLESLKEVTWFVEQPFSIKYILDKKTRNYYPDFLIIIKGCYPVVVEIKPKIKMVLKRNIMKFKGLEKFCEDNGYGHLVIDKNISLKNLIKTNINNEFENEILSLINEHKIIYWDEYKKIRNKYGIKIDDFISIVIKHKLEWTLFPFKIEKGNYCLSDNFFIKNDSNSFNDSIFHNHNKESATKENKKSKFNIDINSIASYTKSKRHGKKWTEEEETQLINEFDKGYNIEQIANIHNRSLKAIRVRLYKHFSKGDVKKRIEKSIQ